MVVRKRVLQRREVKTARLEVERRHVTMVMFGFDAEDLQAIKDSAPMRWDGEVWVFHRADLDAVVEVLEDRDFFVRLREL